MNNQQVSQILTFYRINYNFHDPYRFILDGNFIKLLVEKEFNFQKKLQNVISSKIKLYVPECLIRQLDLLGQDFKLVLKKASQYRKIKCKHGFQVSVDNCIKNLIEENNPNQYIVCTQDINLRRELRDIPNLPLMYFGPDQRIKFQDVQKKNLALLEQKTTKKFLPKEAQMQLIIKDKLQRQKQNKLEEKKKLIKIASTLGVQVKKKIAKGPNPLSVKKKRKVYNEFDKGRNQSEQNDQSEQNQLKDEQDEQIGQNKSEEKKEGQQSDYPQIASTKQKRIRKKNKNKNKNANNFR